MSDSTAFVIRDLPFHIGPTETRSNPSGLPDTYPFELTVDPRNAMLVQRARPGLLELLDRAYRAGLELGTPLADDEFGRPYVEDFLAFVRSQAGRPRRALEIGAGVGYLSRCLKDDGWILDSLEPGAGYQEQWRKYAVEVINDYFPSPRATGPYDLICSYAVVEHVADPEAFLAAVRSHLKPGGKFLLSVPDCSREITLGDPAMLIHEHYNYFDVGSLGTLLRRCGFAAEVRASGFGRAVYASACVSAHDEATGGCADLEAIQTYPSRCHDFIDRARSALADLAARGTLGIYCPTRALAVLPCDLACRFFDDSVSLQGKFVPPFPARIESRAALLESPTDAIVIMSHTFADRLKQALTVLLPHTHILGIAELVGSGPQARVDR